MKNKTAIAFLFLLAPIIIFSLFRFFPLCYAFVLSFFDIGITSDAEFVGFDGYINLFISQDFWASLINTIYFVIGAVPFQIAISMGAAVLINKLIKGVSFFRVGYFLPVVTSMVAVAMVWKWIFNKDGLINHLFAMTGFNWLADGTGIFEYMFDTSLPVLAKGPTPALIAIIIMTIWKGLGYNIVIYIAGLQNIPKHLYESARIDGAGNWQTFRYITFPLLSPTTFYVLLMTTIVSFQAFTQVHLMTQGDPSVGTQILVHYLYDKGFGSASPNHGYASAISIVLFLIILGITIFQKKLEKKVHY